MQKLLMKFLHLFLTKSQIYQYLFNFSPMYRSTNGRIFFVSDDFHNVKIKIPLNYRNRNYVGTMFGGSMLSATDPIYMTQLIEILGEDYIVWDKATTIKFKRPGNSTAFGDFILDINDINDIKNRIRIEKEIDFNKQVNLTSKEGIIFAEIYKTLYIAEKSFYKNKIRLKKQKIK